MAIRSNLLITCHHVVEGTEQRILITLESILRLLEGAWVVAPKPMRARKRSWYSLATWMEMDG